MVDTLLFLRTCWDNLIKNDATATFEIQGQTTPVRLTVGRSEAGTAGSTWWGRATSKVRPLRVDQLRGAVGSTPRCGLGVASRRVASRCEFRKWLRRRFQVSVAAQAPAALRLRFRPFRFCFGGSCGSNAIDCNKKISSTQHASTVGKRLSLISECLVAATELLFGLQLSPEP